MHNAIVRSYATSDHDYTRTVAYMHQVVLSKFPTPAVATFIKRCNGLNATKCGHTTPMPHGTSPIMYPLMVQQETGAPTTPPSSNIGWTLCQEGMCVCDTALARCSNLCSKINPNVPFCRFPMQ